MITTTLIALLTTSLVACGAAAPADSVPMWENKTVTESETAGAIYGEARQSAREITLQFGDTAVTATMDDSETTKAFLNMLPMTITMDRYAEREYYTAIPELPEKGEAIPDFENGDITYYTAGKSLAIFFANADSSNQGDLIRMGRITSDLSLFDTMGRNVSVTISLKETGGKRESTGYDFSEFTNVELTGTDLSDLSEEERSVRYQQARYCQAMTDADTGTMREIVSETMVFTHMSGRRQTREEYFADVENGSLRYFTVGIEKPVVAVNGDLASVTYTSVLNADAYGARGTYRMSGTHWYKKQGDDWIAVNAPEGEK